MSRNVIEKLLHQLCVDRGVKQRFREDADKLLARYALTDEERRMVVTFDVAALQSHGVNPMLTMGYWQENAPDRSPVSYMRALHADAGLADQPVYSASLKQ